MTRVQHLGLDLAAGEASVRFMARFYCTSCGPTNRVVSRGAMVICVPCNPELARTWAFLAEYPRAEGHVPAT